MSLKVFITGNFSVVFSRVIYSLLKAGTTAALMVYISILEQQAKYGDALEFLSGKLGSLLVIEVDKLRIQVLWEGLII